MSLSRNRIAGILCIIFLTWPPLWGEDAQIDHIVPIPDLVGSFSFVTPTMAFVRIHTTPAPGYILIPPGDMVPETTDPATAWNKVYDFPSLNLWEAGGVPGHRVYALVKGKYTPILPGTGTPPDWTTMSVDVDWDGDTNCDGTANLDQNGTIAEIAEDKLEDDPSSVGAPVCMMADDSPPPYIVVRQVLPTSRPQGTVTLSQAGTGKVSFYTNPQRTLPAPADLWSLTKDNDLKLYVKGVTIGGLMVTETYEAPTATGTIQFQDKIKMSVFSLNLTIIDEDGKDVPEAVEADPGYWLCVNNDDDNSNMKPDKFDLSADNREDDFRKVKFVMEGLEGFSTVTLKMTRSSTKLRYWKNNTKTGPTFFPGNSLSESPQITSQDIFVEGTDPAQGDLTIVAACGTTELCRDTVRLTAYEVKSVKYSAAIGLAIDHDPHYAAAEVDKFRLFPDAESEDEASRNVGNSKINVEFELEPTVPTGTLWKIPIQVNLFDPHYYSDNPEFDKSSDPNIPAKIDDNQTGATDPTVGFNDSKEDISFRAVVNPFELLNNVHVSEPKVEYLQTFAVPGTNHRLLVYEIKNLQPGNNIIVAASCSDILSMVHLKMDGTRAQGQYRILEFSDKAQSAGATPVSKISGGTLTVWRKLYIERDHLEPTDLREGQENIASVQKHDVVGLSFVAPFEVHVAGDLPQENQFSQGLIEFWHDRFFLSNEFRGYAQITNNETNLLKTNSIISIDTMPPVDTNTVFIVDDDAVLDKPAAGLRFDRTAKLNCAMPNVSILDTQLRIACIEPDYGVLANYSEHAVLFKLYVSDADLGSFANSHRGSRSSNRYFWTAYVVGLYQAEVMRSADPGFRLGLNGRALWGSSAPVSRRPNQFGVHGVSLIYQETNRDSAVSGTPYVPAFAVDQGEAETVAHEVGHLLGGEHDDGGLMGTGELPVGIPLPPAQGGTAEAPEFTGILLRKIYTFNPEGP